MARIPTPDARNASTFSANANGAGGRMSVYGGLVPLGFSHSNNHNCLYYDRRMPFDLKELFYIKELDETRIFNGFADSLETTLVYHIADFSAMIIYAALLFC